MLINGLGVILVGDKNISGGRVMSGSPANAIHGKGMVRVGDLVDCPAQYADGRPHGINKIVEGCQDVLLYGKAIALHGHRSACGCSLISSIVAIEERRRPG